MLLRKSVYADGGVIGVLRRSSFLTASTFADGSAEGSGLSCSSDGSFGLAVGEVVVFNGANAGFDAGGMVAT